MLLPILFADNMYFLLVYISTLSLATGTGPFGRQITNGHVGPSARERGELINFLILI